MSAIEEEQPPTRETPFKQFISYIARTYVTPEKLDPFLAKRQSPFDSKILIDLFKSKLIQDALPKQWDYERDDKWRPERTANLAISETIGHSLSWLRGETDLFLYRSDRTTFTVQSRDEILAIQQQLILLMDFFDNVLPKHD
jgi:hypothetical protein